MNTQDIYGTHAALDNMPSPSPMDRFRVIGEKTYLYASGGTLLGALLGGIPTGVGGMLMGAITGAFVGYKDSKKLQ